MTIIKVNGFLRTPLGKLTSFLLIIAILNLNSCTVYKAADTSLEQVRNTEQILDHPDVYKFYAHDDYNSYLLSNPVFNADGSISGELTLTNYETPDSTWSKEEKKTYWKDHKYDINIYSTTTLSDLSADLDAGAISKSGTVTITPGMISKITISAIDMEGEMAAAALVALAVVGILLAICLLIVLIAVSLDEGADASSDGSGSGSNSDGSGSGSGSSG